MPPQRRPHPGEVGAVALSLVVEAEQLLRRGVVEDPDPGAAAVDRQVLPHPLDARDRPADRLQARRRPAVEGGEVVPGGLEAQILGAVLPEHAAAGAAGEGQPEQGGQLLRRRLLLPGDPALRHAGVDLLVPPASVRGQGAGGVEAEGLEGDLVRVGGGQQVVRRHRHAPTVDLGGAGLVPGLRDDDAVGAHLVAGVDGPGLGDHPPQLFDEVVAGEAPEHQHLDDVLVVARGGDVIPGAVAAQEAAVELLEGVARPQPALVRGQRMLAVAGVGFEARPPRRHPVPKSPYEKVAPVLVTVHHVAQQVAAALFPHRVVVAMQDGPLRGRGAPRDHQGIAVAVHGADVGVLAQQPFGAGAVRRQGDVEPDVEAVLLRQVEHQVEVLQLVAAGSRLHMVPEAEAAHDAHSRGPDGGKVGVPDLLFRDGGPVVLDADGEGGFGMQVESRIGHGRARGDGMRVEGCRQQERHRGSPGRFPGGHLPFRGPRPAEPQMLARESRWGRTSSLQLRRQETIP